MKDFFFCSNPFVKIKAGSGYLFHSAKPRFQAAFFTIDATKDFKHLDYRGRNLFVVYTRGDGMVLLVLLLVIQNIDRATVKPDASLQQAAAWYVTCQNLEDEKKYGKRGSYHFLTDFNMLTPGLNVLHLEGIDKYIVSYSDGVKSFDNQVAMDKFMVSLGYDDPQLENGYLNVYAPDVKRK